MRVTTTVLVGLLATAVAGVDAESPCVEVEVAAALAHAKVVILGEVTAMTPTDLSGQPAEISRAVRALYRVRVLEEFKGSGAAEYALLGDRPRPPAADGLVYATDGMPLSVGRRYLLFAWGQPDNLQVDPCPPTAPIESAHNTLTLLRQAVSADRPK